MTGVQIVQSQPASTAAASYSQSYSSSSNSSASSSRICYSRDELLNLASSPLARSPPNFDTSVIPNLIAGKTKVKPAAAPAPAPASPTLSDESHDHHDEQFNLEL